MGSLWKGVYWSFSAAWRKFGDWVIASDIVSNYSINTTFTSTSLYKHIAISLWCCEYYLHGIS